MEARAYTCLLFVASTTGGHFWPSNDRCAFEYSSWLAANDLARQLINSEQIEEHFENRLSCWKVKHLSYGRRLILINLVLSSLPMFMMPIFKILKGVLKKIDLYR
jgi:hypothetical protein